MKMLSNKTWLMDIWWGLSVSVGSCALGDPFVHRYNLLKVCDFEMWQV